MPVSGSAIASAIESATGFDFAIPDQPYNKNWVAEVGSIVESMWTGGTTKVADSASGVPQTNPAPPPPYLPWTHTHEVGADGMSVGSGSIGSDKAKEVFDAILGAIKNEVSSSLETASGQAIWAPAEIPHLHAITDVGSYSSAINSAVDGVSGMDRSQAPDLQAMLDAIASEVASALSGGLLSTESDGGSGTHVHSLS